MAMAARMPMIATTIINSMRVKPFCTDFIAGAPLRFRVQTRAAHEAPRWNESKGHARRRQCVEAIDLKDEVGPELVGLVDIVLSQTDATCWRYGHRVTQTVTCARRSNAARAYSIPSFLIRYRSARKLIPRSLAAAVLL